MDQFLEWVSTVDRMLSIAVTGIDVVTVLLLAIALVLAGRRLLRSRTPWTWKPQSLVSLGGAAGILLAASTVIAVFDVPSPMTWLTGGILAMVFVLRSRDGLFWSGLLASLTVLSVLGALLLFLTTLRMEMDNGGLFDGVARLTQLGGLDANPAYPLWWVPMLALAILRYGLPMALSITLSWLVATRPDIPRLERVALVLAMMKFAVMFFEGPSLSLMYLILGAFNDMPIWRVALGLAIAMLLFIAVGAGGLNGVISGRRAAWGLMPVARNAEAVGLTLHGVLGALTSRPGERILDNRSLPVFLAESGKRGVRKLRWFATIMILPVALVACSTAIGPTVVAHEVTVEHMDTEIPLNTQVDAAYHAGGTDIWLHKPDNTLLRADVATGQIHAGPVKAVAMSVAEGNVLALVPDSPPRVVVLNGATTKDLVQLPDGITGPFTVHGDAVYIGAADGTLTKINRTTGRVVKQVTTGASLLKVMARDGQVWTLHTPRNEYDGNYRAVRRDGTTLKETGEQPQQLLLYDLLIPDRGAMWYLGPAAGKYDPNQRWMRQHAIARDLPEDGALSAGKDENSAWITYPAGRVIHLTASASTRRYFHYESVSGIFETEHGTWLVANQYDSLIGPHDGNPNSLLARWNR